MSKSKNTKSQLETYVDRSSNFDKTKNEKFTTIEISDTHKVVERG